MEKRARRLAMEGGLSCYLKPRLRTNGANRDAPATSLMTALSPDDALSLNRRCLFHPGLEYNRHSLPPSPPAAAIQHPVRRSGVAVASLDTRYDPLSPRLFALFLRRASVSWSVSCLVYLLLLDTRATSVDTCHQGHQSLFPGCCYSRHRISHRVRPSSV